MDARATITDHEGQPVIEIYSYSDPVQGGADRQYMAVAMVIGDQTVEELVGAAAYAFARHEARKAHGAKARVPDEHIAAYEAALTTVVEAAMATTEPQWR